MTRGGKIFAVLVIAICGIGAATLFRNAQTRDDSQTDTRFAGLNFRGESNDNLLDQQSARSGSPYPTAPQQLATVRGSTNHPTEQINTDQPPPRLPGGGGTQPPIPGQAKASRSFLDGTNWPAITPDSTNASPALGRELRGHMHKIRDGDTLDDLAKRYLGDPRRATEIFDANRHVLLDPQVLPLGRSIRIPPRRVRREIPSTTSVLRNPNTSSDETLATGKSTPQNSSEDKLEPYDPNKPIPLFGPKTTTKAMIPKKPRTVATPTGSIHEKKPVAEIAKPSVPKAVSPKQPKVEKDQLVPLPSGALRRAREEAERDALNDSAT